MDGTNLQRVAEGLLSERSVTDTERDALLAEIAAHDVVLRRGFARSGPNPMFDSGLTMQQLRVLVLLSTDGPLPQGDLAHALGVGMASVTGLVDRLVARDLVARTEDPHDRRIRLASLAPAGTELMEQISSAGQQTQRALLARIDLDALRGLARGLAALRTVLEADQEGRSSQSNGEDPGTYSSATRPR